MASAFPKVERGASRNAARMVCEGCGAWIEVGYVAGRPLPVMAADLAREGLRASWRIGNGWQRCGTCWERDGVA